MLVFGRDLRTGRSSNAQHPVLRVQNNPSLQETRTSACHE